MHIYTDGACSGNPGPGAYAVVIQPKELGDPVELINTGRKEETTNNEMELAAILEAMYIIWDFFHDGPTAENPQEVVIHSDSNWAIKGATKQWKMNAHKEYWSMVYKMINKCAVNHINVKFEWVKAHNGNKLNELADELAKARVNTFIQNTI